MALGSQSSRLAEEMGKSKAWLSTGWASIVVDCRTSARLGRVRQKGTAPELVVRKALTALGHRYRIRNRDLPGSPDIANRRRGWVVFVHGCFWHSHAGCSRATVPKRNREFWRSKFSDNRKRDSRAQLDLKKLGFLSVVLWECEVFQPAILRRRLTQLRNS